jgi:hypothetical protein
VYYESSNIIPANTAAVNAVRVSITLMPGVIKRVEIQYPTGCAGLAHTRIYRKNVQLWPSNPGGDFAGDGYIIGFNEVYLLDSEPYVFVLEMWNLDDTYQHEIRVRFMLEGFTEYWNETMNPLVFAVAPNGGGI